MDFNAFNHLLKKVTSLTQNELSDGQMSSLERDLLLSYIRQMYEVALEVGQPEMTNSARPKVQPAPVQLIQKPEPAPIIVPPVPVVVEEPRPQVYAPPVMVEEVMETAAVAAAVVMEKPVEVMTAPAPVVEYKTSTPHLQILAPELEELFTIDKVTELSDKLALSQIKDLTKSMGINEKIFTQQELFKNDNNALNEVLQRLNNCQNFEEAKHYLLENVINDYEWTSESKVKKAATFIKLVRRRFV